MNALEIPALTEKQIASFSKKIAFAGQNDCWNWTANTTRTKKGYGEFWINSATFRAHRVSYFLKNGEMPTHLEIDHTCSNTSCVNPNHLEAVTTKENLNRKVARAAAIKAAKEAVQEAELIAA